MSFNSSMTALANAIRSKSGKTGKMGIDAMTQAVKEISVGATVQTKTGSFTTNNSGAATVNCGFKPDIVIFYAPEKNEDGYDYTTAICIEELGSGLEIMELKDKLLYFGAWGISNGFEVSSAQTFDFDWNWAQYSRKTLQYKAIKYT